LKKISEEKAAKETAANIAEWNFLDEHSSTLRHSKVKVGNPAVSFWEIRGFPTPPHGGCGFFNFPAPARKQRYWLINEL
jgi:hypothetical protein